MGGRTPLAGAAVDLVRMQRTVIVAALAGLSLHGTASAQRLVVEPAISARITATDNVNLSPSDRARAGLLVDVRPEVFLTYDGGRLRGRGVVGVNSYTRFGDSYSSSLYPNVNLGATYEAVRDFFFIDADVVAGRQFANPFAPQSDYDRSNAYTSYTTRIAPYIRGEAANFSYFLRNETSWSGNTGSSNDLGNAFEWRINGQLATRRERLGAVYQYDRTYLRYPDDRTFTVEVGRAIGSYQVRPEFSVNARAGYEWLIFPESRNNGVIYGGGFSWQPTPRSDLTAWWEQRFFGPSWLATASHRMPWLAVSVTSSRQLTTTPRDRLTLPVTLDVFSSLDAMLTTRIVDPIQRAQAVRDFMLANGLPATLVQPVPLISDRVDLQIAHMASIALLGGRNTLVLDGYQVERRAITAEGDPLGPTIAALTDVKQRGAAATYSRRLSRADSINTTLLWHSTRGLRLTGDSESDQYTFRVQWSQQIRPRTTGYVGGRYVIYDSNLFTDYRELAVFAGLFHKF